MHIDHHPSPPPMPLVGIIILNWKCLDDTLDCLASLEKLDYPNTRTIVIENGSGDGCAAVIRSKYANIDVLEQAENQGYAGGNNIGMTWAKQQEVDYMLLLNSDVEVDPSFLGRMIDAMEADPKVGIAGPTIYYHSEPGKIWSAGGWVDWRRGHACMIGMGEQDRGQHGTEPRLVDWITGCALLVRTTVIDQVGGLDERFFAYYEEAELCIRARRAGWAIVHVPEAKIWHKITVHAREQSPQVNYYMSRNHLLFLELAGFSRLAWLNALLRDFALRYLNWLVNPRWRQKKKVQRRALFRAVADYHQRRFGRADFTY